MINIRHWRRATAVAILTVLAGSACTPANARPLGPEPAPTSRFAFPDSRWACPLRRVDRQLVRCDDLTGAGVPAPLFIPEL